MTDSILQRPPIDLKVQFTSQVQLNGMSARIGNRALVTNGNPRDQELQKIIMIRLRSITFGSASKEKTALLDAKEHFHELSNIFMF